ncbi:hypothetical protein CHLRE_15g641901v5 [Chlamydomonas reinhardtii]|uniref:Uncharacterized protein n=1 Tax=Chlamydomonas reinhardtii TaxID=3055 RepID=A0A2K3CWV8_CHLRE|nr:uncharacterized protein CHLRE_15g641901v5 [Chlamydomonas reinhardtii]PNW72777.1 hypothetical protein CHLRE_15g641901v5 [Chlamydomonas reinhardtii]
MPLRLLDRVLNKPLTPAGKPFVRLLKAMTKLPAVTLVAPPEPGAWVNWPLSGVYTSWEGKTPASFGCTEKQLENAKK